MEHSPRKVGAGRAYFTNSFYSSTAVSPSALNPPPRPGDGGPKTSEEHPDPSGNNGGGSEPSWTLLLPPPPQHDDDPTTTAANVTAAGLPSVAGPVLICLFLLVSYVGCSSVLLAQLQGWPYLESLYFCFMTILTIGHNVAAAGGHGALLWTADPGGGGEAGILGSLLFILIGLILEATCLHILYEEVYLKVAASGGRRSGGRSAAADGVR